MARLQINYPTPDPIAAPAAPSAPTTYQDMPTKDQRFRLFGLLPFGPGGNTPLYNNTDPAVRSLYGLDDPNRNAAVAGTTAAATGMPAAPVRTPVSSYGVNDTGRTTPFAPNPTYANRTTLPMGGPVYPDGSGSPSAQGELGPWGLPQGGGAANQFGGFLGGLIGLLTGQKQNTGPYEAALRERPEDIQQLVSMSQRGGPQGQNAGGFFGGMFDDKKG